MNGEPVVLTATLITLASTTGSDLRTGEKSLNPKHIVGGFLAMALCAVIAEVDGELGAGLAIAIAGTAFVQFGLPAIQAKPTTLPASAYTITGVPVGPHPTSAQVAAASKQTVPQILAQARANPTVKAG
jgi:hypothetical protein